MEFKAWLMGCIASNGTITDNNIITITTNIKNIYILKQIKKNIDIDTNIMKQNNDIYYLSINSKEIFNNVSKVFNIKNNLLNLNDVNLNEEDLIPFIRGVFEGCDNPIQLRDILQASISNHSRNFLEFIQSKINISSTIYTDNDTYTLIFNGYNALDFLDKIYSNANIRNIKKYEQYLNMCNWSPLMYGNSMASTIHVVRADDRACLPSKTRASDSGYDLTLIDVYKQSGEVTYYETGVKVTPPMGYYFDLVGRSSISKSGYILANSFGVIDRTYTGTIKVPLIKIDKNKPDLELPSRLVQIILRPVIHAQVIEVDTLEDTMRGEGGFGSTGVK